MNTTKHEKNNILLQFWVKETPFKKKKVSVWHTMKWTSRLWLPKNSGSLHIMIFRYCGNISVSMQRYFLKVKGVKKFMFRCHTLTHGTDLRRLPQWFTYISAPLCCTERGLHSKSFEWSPKLQKCCKASMNLIWKEGPMGQSPQICTVS